MKTPRAIPLAAFVIALLPALGPFSFLQAAPLLYAEGDTNTAAVNTPAQTAAGGSVADEESGSHGTGTSQDPVITGKGRASAAFGRLRAFGEASAGVGNPLYKVWGDGIARFEDDVTINAPGMDGRSGKVTIKFILHGELAATHDRSPGSDSNRNRALAAYRFERNDSTVADKEYRVYGDGTTSGTNFLGVEQSATFDVTFGVPFKLELRITASTLAHADAGGHARANLENTATWSGMIVQDEDDNVIARDTVSLVSASDFNWLEPYPAPPVPALVVQRSGNNLEIAFTSEPDVVYQFHTSVDLTEWVSHGTAITGDGTLKSISAPMTSPAGQAFYKLESAWP